MRCRMLQQNQTEPCAWNISQTKSIRCCLDKDRVKSLYYIQGDDQSATPTRTLNLGIQGLPSFLSEQGTCCNWKRMASAKLALLGPAQVSKIRWMQSVVWSWCKSLTACMFCRNTFWESLTIPTMSTMCCHVVAPAGTGTGLLSSNLVSHQTASPGTHGTQNHTDDTTVGVAHHCFHFRTPGTEWVPPWLTWYSSNLLQNGFIPDQVVWPITRQNIVFICLLLVLGIASSSTDCIIPLHTVHLMSPPCPWTGTCDCRLPLDAFALPPAQQSKAALLWPRLAYWFWCTFNTFN